LVLAKSIKVSADAEEIKVYSMDSLQPAITAAGKQSFKWSCARLFTDKTYLALLMAGTKFDLVFAPEGDAEAIQSRLGRTVRFCIVSVQPVKMTVFSRVLMGLLKRLSFQLKAGY
jgi:hypothetical protein